MSGSDALPSLPPVPEGAFEEPQPPPPKRRWLRRAAQALGLFAGLWVLLFAWIWLEPKPKIQGKPLGEWLAVAGSRLPQGRAEAEAVLRNLDPSRLNEVIRFLEWRSTPASRVWQRVRKFFPWPIRRWADRFTAAYDLSDARAGAARALGWHRPPSPEALRALSKAALDQDGWVRQAALEALKELGPPAAPALAEALRRAKPPRDAPVAAALAALGPAAQAALPAVKEKLEQGASPRSLPSYAYLLQACGTPGLELALALLQSSNPRTRDAAQAALPLMLDRNYALLKEFLNRWRGLPPAARMACLSVIRRMSLWDPYRAMALAEALADPAPEVRRAAAAALREMGERAAPAVVRLRDQLRSREAETRRLALEILGGLGEKAALASKQVASLLKDPDPSVRRAAEEALRRIDQGAPPPPTAGAKKPAAPGARP